MSNLVKFFQILLGHDGKTDREVRAILEPVEESTKKIQKKAHQIHTIVQRTVTYQVARATKSL